MFLEQVRAITVFFDGKILAIGTFEENALLKGLFSVS